MAILLVSCLYMAVGAIGFLVNIPQSMRLPQDILIELTELSALVAGVCMFRGCNWARWLALVWMAFHLAISFPAICQVVTHSIIFALIAWILLHPDARRYFTPRKPHSE
jgi:hypothetical protein